MIKGSSSPQRERLCTTDEVSPPPQCPILGVLVAAGTARRPAYISVPSTTKLRLPQCNSGCMIYGAPAACVACPCRFPIFCGRHEQSPPLPPGGGPLVPSDLRRAHAGPGRGVAGDPGRQPRADRRADGQRQDAGGFPGGDRLAGARGARRRPGRRDAGRLRLPPQGPFQRHRAQPRRSSRRHRRRVAQAGPPGSRNSAPGYAPATPRPASAARWRAGRRISS